MVKCTTPVFHPKRNRYSFFTVLRGSLDDEIYMAVRTPAQLRAVLAADHLDEGQAAVIKTGLFNDGIMASESDWERIPTEAVNFLIEMKFVLPCQTAAKPYPIPFTMTLKMQ